MKLFTRTISNIEDTKLNLNTSRLNNAQLRQISGGGDDQGGVVLK